MKRKNKLISLPFVFDNIGRWWGNNPIMRKQEEIDFVATSSTSAIFGECKWKDMVSIDTLNELKRKADMFNQFEKKYYYIFSKGNFSPSLKASASDNIKLISLKDLYAFD